MSRGQSHGLTTGQGIGRVSRVGVVSGHALRVIREQLGLTQDALAERLGVSVDTAAGWESGRRPVIAMPVWQMLKHRRALMRMGAAPALLSVLERAGEADALLTGCLEEAADDGEVPIGSCVLRRDLVEVLTWPLNGVKPNALRSLALPARTRRGPVPDGPELSVDERSRFFEVMRWTAEHARDDFLLRRQALYLAGFDEDRTKSDWLGHQQRSERPQGWLESWLNARSVAAVAARQGDHEPMRHFIAKTLADDAGRAANLNYWAYWVGEYQEVQLSDDFIADRALGGWSGGRLLQHLTSGLDPSHGFFELNVHSLWSLIAVRPALLRANPTSNDVLCAQLHVLLDGHGLIPRVRQELESIRYALRLVQA
ncbi:helix-turn-helix domain-containing protein [Streptomyces sp. NPDC049906]|uniref:helix-turn-helix domain-containing protein n=1 Tax=Streptomyces sp. NPDC049906 TaxID=3155656 RepID=UPI003427E041